MCEQFFIWNPREYGDRVKGEERKEEGKGNRKLEARGVTGTDRNIAISWQGALKNLYITWEIACRRLLRVGRFTRNLHDMKSQAE